tara:strand:+ start:448 stop:1071 length:624 start_codon:yes stop_codon:yes gene_type:complete
MSIVKLNNNGVKNATAFGSGVTSLGSMTFIKKLTASSSSTLSFVDGASSVVLDNTYKEYLFTFNNIHPATDDANFLFNMSADTGSNYNVTKTSTFFRAFHQEDDSQSGLSYYTGGDLAQSTGNQLLSYGCGNDNDQCTTGFLHLFNPSSTTFVKHFISRTNTYESTNNSWGGFAAGYANTTSAIDAVQFQMASGNIDAGDICLYGIA